MKITGVKFLVGVAIISIVLISFGAYHRTKKEVVAKGPDGRQHSVTDRTARKLTLTTEWSDLVRISQSPRETIDIHIMRDDVWYTIEYFIDEIKVGEDEIPPRNIREQLGWKPLHITMNKVRFKLSSRRYAPSARADIIYQVSLAR